MISKINYRRYNTNLEYKASKPALRGQNTSRSNSLLRYKSRSLIIFTTFAAIGISMLVNKSKT